MEPTLPSAQERPSIRNETGSTNAEKRRRQRSLINDVYRIYLPGNRWTYLQLLTPLGEWVRVRLHVQLPVGVDSAGRFVYRSFVSPRDEGLGDEAAHDPIEARTLEDGGWPARDP